MTEENNNSQETKFHPIEAYSKSHVSIDPALVAEFNNKNGDIELVCQDGVVIQCHACVLTYQSDIIRAQLKHAGVSLDCKKYSSSTMNKFVQMMYSQRVVFTCQNDMFQVLFAAIYYNVKGLSPLIQSAIKLHCTRDKDKKINVINCRDTLLVLQENVTYSAEKPNPGYEPYDPSIQPLTEQLIRYLIDCAGQGIAPADIDTVSVVSSVYDYLDTEVNDRCIDDNGPITNLLALWYDEASMVRDDILNAVIRRDVVLTKFLLKIERENVGELLAKNEELGKTHGQEVADLKAQLKTTTEQLRAERQKERRAAPTSSLDSILERSRRARGTIHAFDIH